MSADSRAAHETRRGAKQTCVHAPRCNSLLRLTSDGRGRVAHWAGRFERLRPLGQLERGYPSRVRDGRAEVRAPIRAEMPFSIELRGRTVGARVT